jgi:hypothetical protein
MFSNEIFYKKIGQSYEYIDNLSEVIRHNIAYLKSKLLSNYIFSSKIVFINGKI